jgi:hypothetical protein
MSAAPSVKKMGIRLSMSLFARRNVRRIENARSMPHAGSASVCLHVDDGVLDMSPFLRKAFLALVFLMLHAYVVDGA